MGANVIAPVVESPPAGSRTLTRPLLAGWTCTAMVFGTVAGPAVGILASTLIDRFDLTRSDIGRLSAAYALVGAAVSPLIGRLVDRFGSRRMIAFTFAGGALSFLAYSFANSYAVLLVAAAVSGIPNGSGNPSTNRLIAGLIPPAERGLVTGIKQSGVQLGRFLAGLLLPSMVLAWGLSRSYGVIAVLAAAGAALTFVVLPADHRRGAARPGVAAASPTALPIAVWWLAGYAFLLGASAGATSAFTALYAKERVGMTAASAGFMIGVTGGAAALSRILLSRLSQKLAHYGPMLAWIALGSTVSLAVTAMSQHFGGATLWAGTIGVAITVGSWNSVAMLAAMSAVPIEQAGRSSGRVMVGFLGGLGVAPPIFGWAVDRTNSYPLCWGVLTTTSALATLAMVAWWWTDRSRQRPAADSIRLG